MNSNLLRVACGLILSLSSLSAQSPTDSAKVRFRTLGWMVAPGDLYYDLNGRDTKVSIIESARSVFNDLAKDQKKIVFYRLLPGSTKDKPVREEAATVDISTAGPWPLLIFMANLDAPKHYRVAAVADDLKVFPFPCCRFVNLSPVELHARYGDQKITIAAKGIERLDPHLKPTAETQTRYATVSVDTPQGPRMLYSNNWAVRPTQRTLVFMFSQDEHLQVMRITDDIAVYAAPPP